MSINANHYSKLKQCDIFSERWEWGGKQALRAKGKNALHS